MYRVRMVCGMCYIPPSLDLVLFFSLFSKLLIDQTRFEQQGPDLIVIDVGQFLEVDHVYLFASLCQQDAIFIGHSISLAKAEGYTFGLLLFVMGIHFPRHGRWPDKTNQSITSIEGHGLAFISLLCCFGETFGHEGA